MTDYRKLDVYGEARTLTRDIYFRATRPLPLYLRWRLGGQLDDAVDSIGSTSPKARVERTRFMGTRN